METLNKILVYIYVSMPTEFATKIFILFSCIYFLKYCTSYKFQLVQLLNYFIIKLFLPKLIFNVLV